MNKRTNSNEPAEHVEVDVSYQESEDNYPGEDCADGVRTVDGGSVYTVPYFGAAEAVARGEFTPEEVGWLCGPSKEGGIDLYVGRPGQHMGDVLWHALNLSLQNARKLRDKLDLTLANTESDE